MLQVEISRMASWAVLHVVGEVDLASAPVFRQASQGLLRDGPPGRPAGGVVIDLTACHHLDSVGVGLLLGVHKRCRARGVPSVVVAADPVVRRVLALTEVDRVLTVVDRLDETVLSAPAPTGEGPTGEPVARALTPDASGPAAV